MAKLLILTCFVLFLTLSKAAPISEEVEEDDSREKEDKDDEYIEDNDDDDDFQGKVEVSDDNKVSIDDDERGENIATRDGEEKEAEEKEAEDVSDDNPAEERDDEEEEEEQEDDDDETTDNNAGKELKRSGVVEDSDGAVQIDGNTKKREDDDEGDEIEDDLEEELDDIEDDGESIKSISNGISKLQAIFNDEIPKEIDNLKVVSAKLRDDLAQLNQKLDDFLKQNEETTQTEVTTVTPPTIKSTSEGNDEVQQATNSEGTNDQSESKEFDPRVDDNNLQASENNVNNNGEMPADEMQRMIDNFNANQGTS